VNKNCKTRSAKFQTAYKINQANRSLKQPVSVARNLYVKLLYTSLRPGTGFINTLITWGTELRMEEGALPDRVIILVFRYDQASKKEENSFYIRDLVAALSR
jgi:hypothetical protein